MIQSAHGDDDYLERNITLLNVMGGLYSTIYNIMNNDDILYDIMKRLHMTSNDWMSAYLHNGQHITVLQTT